MSGEGPTDGAASDRPWTFDSGDGTLALVPPGEYGVADYGAPFADPGEGVSLRFTAWLFGPEVGQMIRRPLVRRVGDKRGVLLGFVDALNRPASLEGVSKITLRLTPDGAPFAWIYELLEETLVPFAGAQAAVLAALGSLASDEKVIDIPIAQVASPATDGLATWYPTTEFDAPWTAEARVELEFSGAPNAVVPSIAPQHLVVRR